MLLSLFFFFFNDTATTEIYTLSLHDALPISRAAGLLELELERRRPGRGGRDPHVRSRAGGLVGPPAGKSGGRLGRVEAADVDLDAAVANHRAGARVVLCSLPQEGGLVGIRHHLEREIARRS